MKSHFCTIFTYFDPNDCRLLVEALLMTGSDLCASAKPWDLQMQTVEVIYDEFYKQVCEPEILYYTFIKQNLFEYQIIKYIWIISKTGWFRTWIWAHSCSYHESFLRWTATTTSGRIDHHLYFFFFLLLSMFFVYYEIVDSPRF